jgi:ParB family transcriptional regulator, chromosome partitioning protein
VDDEDMATLTASLRARGQQVPVEVVDISASSPPDRPQWGLLTGWRRLMALRALHAAGEGDGTILAIARKPEDGPSIYVAMIEENEIRANLSFYERARIVVQAVGQGVFRTDRVGLAHLFAAAPATRRSKIGSFIRVVRALDGSLRFPAALSEKAGLALAAALDVDATLAPRLVAALDAAPPQTPQAEAALIARALRPAPPQSRAPGLDAPLSEPVLTDALGPVTVTQDGPDRLILSGPALTTGPFRDRLLRWLAQQNRL